MAKPVDETLQEESGERLGFVLMCFEFGEGENRHFSYVSNAGRETMTILLKNLLAHWEAGEFDDPKKKI